MALLNADISYLSKASIDWLTANRLTNKMHSRGQAMLTPTRRSYLRRDRLVMRYCYKLDLSRPDEITEKTNKGYNRTPQIF